MTIATQLLETETIEGEKLYALLGQMQSEAKNLPQPIEV
jgi:hypothetical protein